MWPRRVVSSAPALTIVVTVGAIAAALWRLSPTGDLAAVALAFWNGSVGSASALLSGTLVRAIPLAIIGTGLSIAFRAGVFNIGGEGQFLAGAAAATVVGLSGDTRFGSLTVLAALAAGAAGGALWAGIAAVLRYRFGVLEVVSTIMLNFVAANLVAYLVRGPMQEPTGAYPQTALIAAGARLDPLIPGWRLHTGAVLALLTCVAGWGFLRWTAAGFRVRAAGASPGAAAVIGRVDVGRVAFGALVASGALAGVAGGIEVAGVTFALYENLSPGYGYSAIAVAILARLQPLAVLAVAVAFGALETGALGMQRDAGVPSAVATAIEAVAILAVIAARTWTPSVTTRERTHRIAPDAL